MPRDRDRFREYVEPLDNNNRWKCNFCRKEYKGSATRIKAHLAGLERYGIHGCEAVDGGVRSEARKALKGKGPVDSSNGSEGNVQGSPYPHLISSSLTQGLHQPVTVSNEDAWRETSFAAMPNLSSDAISTVGASSSAFHPLHEMNVSSQSLPAQNMILQRHFSVWTQPPQSHAGDSYIQLQNLSYPRSGGDLASEALTNMPGPVNAREGEPNTKVPQDARTDDAVGVSRPGNCGLVDENMPTLKRKLEELSNQEANMDELETWRSRAKRIKREFSSMVQAFREGSLSPQQIERVDDLSKEVEEILGHCSFQKGSTTHAAGCRKSSPLVTTELVGVKSEKTIKEICEHLMEDEIFIIGIHGMGGIGKTAILMHVHNRVLENPAFNNVFWVTVPQEFSVYELQDQIANVAGLDNLSKDKDLKSRASILDRHLKKKKSVLLLDGLWMHFEVKDVGIPIGKGDLKLVLTTRSLDVSHKMLCQKQIRIETLPWQDGWNLFLEKLCYGKKFPLEVEEIVRSILRKCEGLPLGIIDIATHMRGVETVYEWKNLLQKLEDSTMELDVFKKLKLSYMKLGNPQVQRCFLHLILRFGEYYYTREDLIESFIDEGLLGGIATRQKMHDQGNIILDKIHKACLGVDIEEEDFYVHPLIKDMALQIVTSTTHGVKAFRGLKEIPGEGFWTDDLEKVFLQSNDINEIPDGISPNCPKLTTMSLNQNVMLRVIPESFFMHLKGLKVLDLSNTNITELPDPISHLESLEALLLRGCEELRRIPCVRKLGSLRKLDLKGCKMIEEAPEGMEMLVNLTYLDLDGTMIETLPEGVLQNLVNLQYLAVQGLKGGEQIELKKVEALYCSVPNAETFNACTRFLEQNCSQKYQLALNVSIGYIFSFFNRRRIIIESCHSIAAKVDGKIGGNDRALLPGNVQLLEVRRCHGVTSLFEVGPLYNLKELRIKEWEKLEQMDIVSFPHLQKLYITECSKLKHLSMKGQRLPRLQWFEIAGSEELEGINIAAPVLEHIVVGECPKMKRVMEWEWLATRLPNLKSIRIANCEKLEEILGGPVPSGATCLLEHLEISGCNNLKRVLMTHGMLLHLPFLQRITVKDCKGIEVIIGTIPNSNRTHSSFQKLTYLTLFNLPELKSICDGTVSCDSLSWIDISKCPKLKRIPLQLPLLDSGLPSPPHFPPHIWIEQAVWETLEWDHQPLARSILEPFVSFTCYF